MNCKYDTLLLLIATFTLSVSQTSAQSLRQILELPINIIESKWEINTQEAEELNYYNGDYCDYYLFRENDQSYNLRPGKNTVFSILKNSHVDNPFKNPSTYIFYRGQFPEKLQINTPYALPVKNGGKTSWKIDLRESRKTLNFQLKSGDTVYATRSGIACQTTRLLQLLIYHSDRTFAAYLMMSRNFIHPGEEVLVGQPVGLAGEMGVSISYFFLDKNKFNANLPSGYPYSHFTPVFRTTEGDIKTKEKKEYYSIIDDALIMQDMSKREQKKYLKKKK
jgi:hypothetical protein bacD2_05740